MQLDLQVVRSLPQVTRDSKTRYAARNQGTGAGEVEIRNLNLRSRTDYSEIGKSTPPATVGTLLGTGGSDVLVRRRVLYANDEPTQLADSYYPWQVAERCPALQQADSGRGGSYSRLAEVGLAPARFVEDVHVRMPTEQEQRLLDLEPTQIVFNITHVAYSAADQPVEVSLHVMPGHLWILRYGWDDDLSETAR